MIFNKPIWAPNLILVDSPVSGDDQLDIATQVIDKLNMVNKVIAICTLDNGSVVNEEKLIIEQFDYSIYREVNCSSQTLGSKLLANNAKIVYYIVSNANAYKAAIINVYDLINTEYPILCVSKHLSADVMPAAIIVPNERDSQYLIEKNVPSAKDGKVMTLDEFKTKKIHFVNQAYSLS